MSQDFQTIDATVPGGDTGTTLTTKLNQWRASILSLFSGATRPSVAASGTPWLDTATTPWKLKMYNGTSDITILEIDPTNLRPIFNGAVPWIDSGGSANAITATYSPVIGALIDGMLLAFRATTANTTSTPTFSPNGLTAKTIVKHNNAALVAGDIVGNSHEVLVRYAADIDKWVLLNPAFSGSGDATSIIKTGDIKYRLTGGTDTGFVRVNGRTVGNASSSATERANADTLALFTYLYDNTFGGSLLTVSGGRGASAAADFAANKTITLPDARGRAPFGTADMGSSDSGRLSTVSGSGSAGTGFGSESVTLILANLPSHLHSDGTLSVDSHSHGAGTYAVGTSITNGTLVVRNLDNGDFGTFSANGGTHDVFDSISAPTNTLVLASGSVSGTGSSNTAGVSGNTGSAGSGTAFSILPPGMTVTWYMKL